MNNIFLALDFPSWKDASHFIKFHQLDRVPVKIGMELFYQEGPTIIEKLKANEHPIFLDLKLHDIPNTVHNAMKNLAKLEVDIVNVHALGGSEMMTKAKEGLISANSNHNTKLIAVTLLTSHDDETITNELKLRDDLSTSAIHLAKLAKQNGIDGVVCSAHEATAIKEACGNSFLTVTPGIRLSHSGNDDQKRIATPKFAAKNKCDILVIGRSITQADDPHDAYEQAVKEWANGLK